MRSDWEFLLLTSRGSHAELATLEAGNVRRIEVSARSADGAASTPSAPPEPTNALRALARSGLQLTPAPFRVKTKSVVWRWRQGHKNARLLDSLRPDLLFCPFTVTYYGRPGTRLVAIVHDLQHVAYPEFFSADQRISRARQLGEACRTADRIVCVSEHVRRTLVQHLGSCDDRIRAIPHGLLQEAEPGPFGPRPGHTLERFGLVEGGYLLYPANFWPHKNHLRLFEALRAARHCGVAPTLVCTGAASPAMSELDRRAADLVGPGAVVFAGYLERTEFQHVLDGCKALIYPSLYEGFGLPVLEAMARGKPVLCSNVASLPEVAGDAGCYFEPRDVDGMARAIASLEDHNQVQRRIDLGRARAETFGSAADMARRYAAVFDEVLETVPATSDEAGQVSHG
jgi:glycosyltransferase involved in cell wall biosynthesis